MGSFVFEEYTAVFDCTAEVINARAAGLEAPDGRTVFLADCANCLQTFLKKNTNVR